MSTNAAAVMHTPSSSVDTRVFVHVPVLLENVLALARLAAVPASRPLQIVDCTLGGAGHARALLEALPQAHLLGIDRDPDACTIARTRLAEFGERVRVVQAPFSELSIVLEDVGMPEVDVLLADFGVSSYQLDAAKRGFSFREHGPLDMRMNPDAGEPAHALLARIEMGPLAHAIATLGEERHARRVARAIVADRPSTTEDLAALVRRVVPQGKDRIDPATRTFQAIRMLVNDELGEIDAWLAAVPAVLAEGGIAMAISFHSLEDRRVKAAWRAAAGSCTCPPHMPVCACKHVPTLHNIMRRCAVASDTELHSNPRARSARLRAVARLARQS